MSNRDKERSFIEHLAELRNRLIVCIIVMLICAGFVYTQTTRILEYLISDVGKLFFFSPTEAFVVRMKIALWGGLYIALPVFFYEIWRFVEIGLRNYERKYLFIPTLFSVLLFTVGAVFGYFIMVPIGIKFLLGCGTETLQPMLSVSKYVSFVANLLLGFGLSFQLPIAVCVLAKLGIVSHRFLIEKQKYAILLIFIIAAALTPPDVFSQLLMAGPLLVLYEISILVAWVVGRKRQESIVNA